MERITKRAGATTVIYDGEHRQYDGGDIAAEMSTAGIRDALCRLAAYEDTGLTPEEIAVLMNPATQKMTDAIVEAIPQLVQFIVENAPKLVETYADNLVLQFNMQDETVAALHRMGAKAHMEGRPWED